MVQQRKTAVDGFSRGFLLHRPEKSRSTSTDTGRAASSAERTSECFHKNQSTFRRGFLNKKAPKTNRKEMTIKSNPKETVTENDASISADHRPASSCQKPGSKTSSALLDMEEEYTTNSANASGKSLLFVEEQTKESLDPVVAVDENDENDCDQESASVGLTEIRTSTIRRKKGTMVSEYLPSGHRASRPEHRDSGISREDGDDKIGFDQSYTADPVKTHENSMSTQQNPGIERTDFVQCQQELDRTLWRIRRKKHHLQEWRGIASEFCRNLRLEMLTCVWESLFAYCPTGSNQNLAERRLGFVLLENTKTAFQWESFASFLLPQQDKESRILTLGAITILDFWNQMSSPVSPGWMVDLIKYCFSPLAQQVTNHTKRTVLAQRAMMVSYSLVATAAEYSELHTGNDRSILQGELWSLRFALISVWEKQICWNIQENRTAESLRVAARKNCTNAVILDWKEQANEVVGEEAATAWCRSLLGVQVEGQEEALGSLRQTLLKSKNSWTAGDFVACIQQAMQHDNGEAHSETCRERQTTIMRGVVAWLGQHKKHLSWLLDHQNDQSTHASFYEQVFEATNLVLRYALSDRTVNLSLEVLDALWSDSQGMPPDVIAICNESSYASHPNEEHRRQAGDEETAQQLPRPVRQWVDLLGEKDEASLIPASREALCTLIAQSIVQFCIGSSTGVSLSKEAIRVMIAEIGMNESSINTLLLILKMLQVPIIDTDNVQFVEDRQILADYIGCDLLLRNLQDNVAVQEGIRKEQLQHVDPFLDCSLDKIISQEVRILSTLVDAPEIRCKAAVDALVVSLTSILQRELCLLVRETHGTCDDGRNCVVTKLVETLMSLTGGEGNTDDIPEKIEQPRGISESRCIEKTCFQFGTAWRRLLLERKDCDANAFGRVLVTIGRKIIQFPASVVPLTLFGAILGASEDYDDDDGKNEHELRWISKSDRVRSAGVSLVKLALGEMEKFSSWHSATTTTANADIFCRLAPLLMLRRIPPGFCRRAFEHLSQPDKCNDTEMSDLLSRLASQLSARLDIFSALESSVAESPHHEAAISYSPEERQMAAEVAGRCLPFTIDGEGITVDSSQQHTDHCSCFHTICLPSLTGMTKALLDERVLNAADDDDTVSLVRRARAAIYTVCHFITFTKLEDRKSSEEAVLIVAGFCLHFLNIEEDKFESVIVEENWLQLQAGCIEFFALCIERYIDFRYAERTATSGVPEHFKEIYEIILEIVQTADILNMQQKEWLKKPVVLATNGGNRNEQHRSCNFSIPCRTCLWNSLIVVSQRCSEDGNKLDFLARTTLPWLLNWSGSHCGEKGQSPQDDFLCSAAALQLAFILITRTKSFAGVASVQMLHHWGLRSIRESKGFSDYAKTSLRGSGLKLVLAIVTICQLNSNQAGTPSLPLIASDLNETFLVLSDIAKQDPDPDLQALASHILAVGLR